MRLIVTPKSVALLAAILLVAGCRHTAGRGAIGGGEYPALQTGEPHATILVLEADFDITPQAMTARGGKIVFNIVNTGQTEHNFIVCASNPTDSVAGCPQTQLLTAEGINPGKNRVVDVRLAAGEYKVVCTLPGHEEAGMVATLTIRP